MLEELLSDNQLGEFGAVEVCANLLTALVLSLATSYVYRITHSGYSYSRSFNVTLVSVAMTITMIMMIIGNYWVLSLGLVGALSIIRFRSAIKDPRDIAFLFLVIAIGLACSTGNYTISVLGTFIINGTLLVLHWLRFGGGGSGGFCLTVTLDDSATLAEAVSHAARQKGVDLQFRSYANVGGQLGEYVYMAELGAVPETDFIAHLRKNVPGIEQLSLIAPETSLEL